MLIAMRTRSLTTGQAAEEPLPGNGGDAERGAGDEEPRTADKPGRDEWDWMLVSDASGAIAWQRQDRHA